MNCRECEALLPLLEDQCLPEEQASALQEHLDACSHCARNADTYHRLLERLHACRREVYAPPHFHDQVMARVAAERARQGRGWLPWLPLAAGSATAAALLAFLLVAQPETLTLVRPASKHAPRNAVPAELAQAPAPETAAQETGAAKRTEAPMALMFAAENALAAAPESPPPLARGIRQVGFGLDRGVSAALSAPQKRLAATALGEAYRMPAPAKTSAPAPSEWSGAACAIHAPEARIVRSQTDLDRLWAESGVSPVLTALPPGHMLAAVFLGDRPGSGDDIQLVALTPHPDHQLLQYRVRESAASASGASQPYWLVLLPASNRPVRFEAVR